MVADRKGDVSSAMMKDREDPAWPLIQLVQQGAMARIVCASAELGIADLLASGPKRVTELAQSTETHAPSLRRLLRALVTLELFTECEDGSFSLLPRGDALRSDSANSVRSWMLWFGQHQWPVWGQLLHSVKTGEPARSSNIFEFFDRDPEAAARFNGAMLELTRFVAKDVVHAYDFTGLQRILDVGGGRGTLLAAILNAHAGPRGILLELPHATEGARSNLTDSGVIDRCDLVTGNFFETVPSGADAYILKNIIHDWDDERAALILRNCRRATTPHAKLLLIERIIPLRLEASPAHRTIAYADMAMLVGPGGRERTEEEFRLLLEGAGFGLSRVIATAQEYRILEAVPH
jgi:orsellinic acid C2-O-methyltransferase